MRKLVAVYIALLFAITTYSPVSSSAAAPDATNKNQTVPAPEFSDAPDIVSSTPSAVSTSSSNEMPSSTTPAPTSGRETNSPSPIIRGTLDNDPRWWKTSERFEIASIEGYSESYDADEPILFYVAGKSDKMDVTKENGFYVAAGLDNLTDSAGDIAAVKYDSDRRAWRVKITGKRDYYKQYEVSIHLACGSESNSPCATEYGYGSIINKILLYQMK